jgi:hypothetical protein
MRLTEHLFYARMFQLIKNPLSRVFYWLAFKNTNELLVSFFSFLLSGWRINQGFHA